MRKEAAAYLKLIGIGALIGVPAALVAVVFLGLVHEAEHLLWTELPEQLGHDVPPWYLVVGLPVVGAALVYVARRYLPGDGGHRPLEGLSGEPTDYRSAAGVALAALGTLAFGAVLGPEAPLIALGSAVGTLALAFVSTTTPQQRQVVATAGSFSAISALFGGPLVAGMLMLEGGLSAGPALIPALLPGLVAAAVGYLLFVGIGDWSGLDTTPLSIPTLPAYDGTHVLDLLLAVVVGVLTVLVVVGIRRGATRLETLGDRREGGAADSEAGRGGPRLLLLLGGGLAVGVLAQTAGLLGADPQDVLFSGQTGIPSLVAETSVGVVVVLLVAKGLGYLVSLGCGFRGGPIFPAVFLGIAVAMPAVIWLDQSPTWAVAVGAAAGMTAGTGLVFSSLLFADLLVARQGLDAMPAAVFAVASAWLVREGLARRQREAATGRETATPAD